MTRSWTLAVWTHDVGRAVGVDRTDDRQLDRELFVLFEECGEVVGPW